MRIIRHWPKALQDASVDLREEEVRALTALTATSKVKVC